MHLRAISQQRPAVAQGAGGILQFILDLLALQSAVTGVIELWRGLKEG
jgi:hypothetical protein